VKKSGLFDNVLLPPKIEGGVNLDLQKYDNGGGLFKSL
jgi:hypothetical protein